jgi:hypothetical protein
MNKEGSGDVKILSYYANTCKNTRTPIRTIGVPGTSEPTEIKFAPQKFGVDLNSGYYNLTQIR